MCQYSAEDGQGNHWHMIHLGGMALSGAAVAIQLGHAGRKRSGHVPWKGGQPIPLGPSYQVPFAEKVRAETGLPVVSVGLITEPQQAEDIIAEGRADFVALACGMLYDPRWGLACRRRTSTRPCSAIPSSARDKALRRM